MRVRKGQVQIWKEKCILLAFFDDNDDGEDDELQKPDLEWSKRECEKARSRSGRKNEYY